MHDVYIYDKGQDFDSLGLVGALKAASCVYDTNAGEAGEITLEHPFDDLGKWSFLQEGRILKAWVPVRVTPLINISPTTQTITREVYKVKTNGGRLRLRQKPNTSAKILARYNPGSEVVKLDDAGTANGHTWYKVSAVKDGQTGYMAATYLTYVRSYTETVGSSGSVQLPESTDEAGKTNWAVRPQLFEIYRKAGNSEGITVYARHISYKLLKNATTYEPSGAVTLQDALNGILSNCRIGHDFHAYTDISEARSDISWHEINPIKALLDAETGAAAKWSAQVVFDNWDMFFLKRAGRNRGMRIEHGKNLVGVESNEDITNTATRIMPIGKKKDGTDLLLPELYIDSKNIGRYDDPMLYPLECSDCKVGDKMTEEQAFTEMRKRAQDMLDAGCDQPEVSMSVDFVSLGDSEEYAQFREMDKLFMYDEIQIVSKHGYADAAAQVTAMTWDCLHDRVLGLGVGSVAANLSTGKLASWQIPSGINGGKIAYGSVGPSQLGADVISARHMQADSVNAKAIQAEAITAEHIKAGALDAITIKAITAHIQEIVAGNITADQLYVDLAIIAAAQITAANIEKANINWAEIQTLTAQVAEITEATIKTGEIEWAEIQTLNAQIANVANAAIRDAKIKSAQIDDLKATVAEIFSASIKTADIDYAQIKDLLANQAIIEDGVGDTLLINRLYVTAANILGATIGKLVLKGSDGKYYAVVVGADGTIYTEEVTVTNGEIAAGQTSSGLEIVETNMNVQSMNAQNIRAQQAIIAKIFTSALTAGKITAGEALIASATIPVLYVTAISAIGNSIDLKANESVKLLVGEKSKTFYQGSEPKEHSAGDTWINSVDGRTYIAQGLSDISSLELAVDDDFELSYRFEGDAFALDMDENGYLLATESFVEIDEDGDFARAPEWLPILPSELHTSFIEIAQDYINILSGGNVNIHAGGELNVNSGAAHFRTAEYTLSILDSDGSEDTVMDFDADGKVLRVTEIEAGNMRPYVPGTTRVLSGSVGGLDGLKGMLRKSRYEHVIYTQSTPDVSKEPVAIEGCDSLRVEIAAAIPTRVPPLAFVNCASTVEIRNLKWTCPGQTAVRADSGSVLLRGCHADADVGIEASGTARMVWIGSDTAETAGECVTAARATDGAEIRLHGLIPAGSLTEALAGTIKAVNTRTGIGGTVEETEKTVTLSGELGYYGTANGWHADMAYQGYSSGKGRIYGCMRFTLPEGAKNVTAATLTLTRDGSAGRGSPADVTLYASASAFGTRPELGGIIAERKDALNSDAAASFDVTAAAQDMADGKVSQLVLYTGESSAMSGKVYSKQYAKITKAALKITYR